MSNSDEDTIDLLHTIHGICMWTGMGLLVPIGIFGAKFKKVFKGNWYNIHAIGERLATFLMLAGFVIAVVSVAIDDDAEHFKEPHQIGGLIVFVLMLIQGIAGTFRPAASIGDGMKTKQRAFWERGHKGMGYFTWLFGQIVLFSGLYNYIDEALGLAQIGWVILVIIIYVGFLFKSYRDNKGRGYFFKDEHESVDMTSKLNQNGDKQNYI